MVLLVGMVALSTTGASASVSTQLQTARDNLANCQLLAANATSSAQRTRAQQCVTDQSRIIALLTASPTPSGSPTASPTASATPTVPPTTVPPTTTPAPTTVPPTTGPPPGDTLLCPPFPAFPDEHCTGYAHTGLKQSDLRVCDEGDGENDGHLTVANRVFDGCLFEGAQSFIRIRAANIVIKNSLVRGCIATHYLTPGQYMGLKLIDVEITTPCTDNAPVGDGRDYSCLRCYVHGTSTGLGGGTNVSIVDSYSTEMVYSDGAHQATVGMNNGLNITILHNRLNCYRVFPPGVTHNQGCSAALSLYDEGPLDGVLVKNNFFQAAGEYCAYSGGPTGRNVRFESNVFSVVDFAGNPRPKCGNSGPLHSWWDNGSNGYVWLDNHYADGRVVTP
jgi:hypothetical protein